MTTAVADMQDWERFLSDLDKASKLKYQNADALSFCQSKQLQYDVSSAITLLR